MAKLHATIAALLACGAAAAQTPAIQAHIEAPGNITIEQPAALALLLAHPANHAVASDAESSDAKSEAPRMRTGYRIQVFDDNNPRTARAQAEARHAQVAAEFPDMGVYVTFNSPYWRVKVGDFRTRAQAEAALAELRHAFPAMAAYMRIVRDKINTGE